MVTRITGEFEHISGLRRKIRSPAFPNPSLRARYSYFAHVEAALYLWPRNYFAQFTAGKALHRTIFNTPVVNRVLRAVSLVFLRLAGWKIEGSLPEGAGKCVLIAAPHTSNWDLPYTLFTAFALNLRIYWMGKQSLFKWPFGALMRWLGGLAVDRSKSNNLVAASAQAIQAADGPLQLVVPPEGTRGKTRHWKTGFYHIAIAAQVPIVLAYIDYQRKVSGLGPVFQPSGDIEADMAAIKAFYAPIKGHNATQFEAE